MYYFSLLAAAAACAAIPTVAVADTLVASQIMAGYQTESIELGIPFGGSIAAIPPHADRLYVSAGDFGNQVVLRVDARAGTTATVAAGFGFIGGLAILHNGDLAITDNDDFSSDTILRARDLNSDGDFLDAGEVTELIAPILADASFTGAQMAVAAAGNAAGLPAGTLLVQTADGGTSSELLAIQNPETAPSYMPAGQAWYSGFMYNGGVAFDSAGNVIMGVSEFPDARIVALVNSNGNDRIDEGESHTLSHSPDVPGIADLSVTAEGRVLFADGTGTIRWGELPGDLLGGTMAAPEPFVVTNANYVSSARLAAPESSFAPYASGETAVLYVGGFVTFPAATNLLSVRPAERSAAGGWHLYD